VLSDTPTAHAGKEYAAMTDSSSHPYSFPECPVDPGVESRDVLTQVLRNGAQDMLARAVLDEVAMYVAERADLVDDQGHHLIVRNGYLPQRKIMTGIGAVEVQQP
jgi:putative transposase